MVKKKRIDDVMIELRAFINDSYIQEQYIHDANLWNRITVSMDTIEDTQNAINFYFESKESNNIGENYILLYGLLQAFVVQQDAVKTISKSINIKKNKFVFPADIKNIRSIRNDTIG